jgi:DNA-binding LacI/PurR family transcriptional regulator
MEELGYRPNFLAQSLATRTSNNIGLVVSTFNGFYFGRLLQQASRQAEAYGKQLIVTDGHDAPEREELAVQMLADRRCDAIILYTRFMSESDHPPDRYDPDAAYRDQPRSVSGPR